MQTSSCFLPESPSRAFVLLTPFAKYRPKGWEPGFHGLLDESRIICNARGWYRTEIRIAVKAFTPPRPSPPLWGISGESGKFKPDLPPNRTSRLITSAEPSQPACSSGTNRMPGREALCPATAGTRVQESPGGCLRSQRPRKNRWSDRQ